VALLGVLEVEGVFVDIANVLGVNFLRRLGGAFELPLCGVQLTGGDSTFDLFEGEEGRRREGRDK
jgi:hypothetical protein